jgi:hypothetical protein
LHSPYRSKIEHKLSLVHPDLPVVVIHNLYGGVFSQTPDVKRVTVGRVWTSLFAMSCMRAQQGVGPQPLGHVVGLKKAWEDGSWRLDRSAGSEKAIEWLTSDEGCAWVLRTIDELVERTRRS